MRGIRKGACLSALAVVVAVAWPAWAKPKEPPTPKPADLRGAAFIDQVDAPADWRTDDEFWIEADSLVPPQLLDPSRSDKIVIADPGNVATQAQTGADEVEFVFQWGRGNTVEQRQAGSGNILEAIQVSPGAMAGRKANAGAGNGPELDVFGNEVDPGTSGAHNKSPEAGGSSATAAAGGNLARQDQSATGSLARAVQVGSGNEAQQVQRGSGNASTIVQLGRQNRAESQQITSGNTSVISQEGTGNTAVVRQ